MCLTWYFVGAKGLGDANLHCNRETLVHFKKVAKMSNFDHKSPSSFIWANRPFNKGSRSRLIFEVIKAIIIIIWKLPTWRRKPRRKPTGLWFNSVFGCFFATQLVRQLHQIGVCVLSFWSVAFFGGGFINPMLGNRYVRSRVLLWFIKSILGNRYVRCRGFIVSEPRKTHPRSEIADVPTSPCPLYR